MTKTLFLPWNHNCPQNQVIAVGDHILSSLTLTVEDLEDSLEELDEKIRSFVVNTGSKYKANHRVFENFRAKFFGKNKEQFFEKRRKRRDSCCYRESQKNTKALC